MTLEVKLGATVTITLEGHSSINGATIPDGSTIALTSNDPTVATASFGPLPPGGAQSLSAPVTILAVGQTDFHAVVTAPDTTIFEATATLLVDPAPEPGLAFVTLVLSQS